MGLFNDLRRPPPALFSLLRSSVLSPSKPCVRQSARGLVRIVSRAVSAFFNGADRRLHVDQSGTVTDLPAIRKEMSQIMSFKAGAGMDYARQPKSRRYMPRMARLMPNAGMQTRQIPRLSLKYNVFHHKIRDSNATRCLTSSSSTTGSWVKVK